MKIKITDYKNEIIIIILDVILLNLPLSMYISIPCMIILSIFIIYVRYIQLKEEKKLLSTIENQEQYIILKTKFDRIVREFRVESIYFDIDQQRTVKNPKWKLKLHEEFTYEELQILIDKGNIDDSDILIMVK